MADEPVSLAEARVERTRDCTKWTPAEMLACAAREVAARTDVEQALVLYYRKNPGGSLTPKFYAAGLSHAEYIALCTLGLHEAIDEWRGRS